MIPAEFDYVAPDTLDEALTALSQGGEDAKLLAGGHSLLPLMKLRLAAPTLLVDLRRGPDLAGISPHGGLKIGAMTTHTAIANADLGLISEVSSTIADPQVRNRGTLGGSLAHGDPASDQPALPPPPRAPRSRLPTGAPGRWGALAAAPRSRPPTCSRTTSRPRSATTR